MTENTTQTKAKRLLELNLTPVLLGSQGDALKRPMLKNWQTAVITAENVATWPAGHNVGIRGGQQPDGRYLLVFDFDYQAATIFTAWRPLAEKILGRPLVVVSSGKGYHAYFYTQHDTAGRKMAMSADQETLIETIGTKRQVVSAGSLHPNGKRYQFVTAATYSSIPTLTEDEYTQLVTLSETFDKRPAKAVQAHKVAATTGDQGTGELVGVADCWDYAKRYILPTLSQYTSAGEERATEKQLRRKNDKGEYVTDTELYIHGFAGLRILKSANIWYVFGEETGGTLPDLVAWHKKIDLAAAHAMLRPESNFTLYPGKHALTVQLHKGQFLGDVAFNLPAKCLLKANTGIGKTTYAVTLPGKVLLVVPTQAILEQQAFRNPGCQVCYQHADTVTPGGGQLIITTPDSFLKVLKKIDAREYSLVVDEAHNFAVAGYRKRAYDNVIRALNGDWQRVILMTGTPLPLVTGNLEIFQSVAVQSPTRKQTAVQVRYPKGEKLQTVIDLAPVAMGDHDHVTIILNDKHNQLPKLEYLLKTKCGLVDDQINIVNADTKANEVYKAMVEEEIIPAAVRVTIATSVLAEGFNLHLEPVTLADGNDLQRKNTIIFASSVSSVEAQQFVNRFRGAAAHMVYWLNNGDGKATFFNYLTTAKDLLKRAEIAATAANTANDDHMVKLELKALNSLFTAQLVEREQDEYIGDELVNAGSWQASAVGVNHAAFSMMKAAENSSPEIFKRSTGVFGWSWGNDLVVTSQMDDTARKGAKIYAAARQEETAVWVSYLAEDIRAAGTAVLLEKITSSGQSSDYYQVGRTVATVWGMVQDFNIACDLAPLAGLSTRKQNTLKRRVGIQVERPLNPHTQALYSFFSVGQRYTPEVIQETITAVFKGSQLAAALMADVNGYEVLSSRKAVNMLKDYFQIKRAKVTTADGARVNCYEIVADRPEVSGVVLPDLVPAASSVSLNLTPIKENSETNKTAVPEIINPNDICPPGVDFTAWFARKTAQNGYALA